MEIMIYGSIMFACGLAAGLLRQRFIEARIRDVQDEYGKPDEEIVCSNATVVVDKRGEISWYNNKRVPYVVRKDEDEN